MTRTHEVANQPPPLEGRNLFDDNVALVEALDARGRRLGAASAAREVGRAWGAEPVRWGFEANEHPPRLRTFDRYGHRIDEVEFHPAWHDLMALAIAHELHSLPWTASEPGAHVARTALYLTATQAEGGFACPITMTFAAVPALRAQPELAAEWEPRLTATTYDPALRRAGQAQRAVRHGDDREAGRLRRAREHDGRAVGGDGPGDGVRAHRPQVVLLGADVRPLPRARADRRGPVVLRAAADPRPTARATPCTSSA